MQVIVTETNPVLVLVDEDAVHVVHPAIAVGLDDPYEFEPENEQLTHYAEVVDVYATK